MCAEAAVLPEHIQIQAELVWWGVAGRVIGQVAEAVEETALGVRARREMLGGVAVRVAAGGGAGLHAAALVATQPDHRM